MFSCLVFEWCEESLNWWRKGWRQWWRWGSSRWRHPHVSASHTEGLKLLITGSMCGLCVLVQSGSSAHGPHELLQPESSESQTPPASCHSSHLNSVTSAHDDITSRPHWFIDLCSVFITLIVTHLLLISLTIISGTWSAQIVMSARRCVELNANV